MRRGHSIPLPRYSDRHGWQGGERHRLYAFVDKRTGHVRVAPVYSARTIGPEVTVRPATRSEGERLWQSPLHPDWKVIER